MKVAGCVCARFYVFGALIHCGRRRGGLRMFRSPLSVFQCKFPLSFITCLFFFSQKLQFLWLIGNKTSCRPIQSAVTLVINKSDSHCPVVRFCYHSYDNRPNWTPLSHITINYEILQLLVETKLLKITCNRGTENWSLHNMFRLHTDKASRYRYKLTSNTERACEI